MDEARNNMPLAGVTVIDFGQIFQGPYATLLMAKAGAFVIKVEPPRGEPGRRRAEPGKSATLPFAMLNQNKHAITLNLKEPRGRECCSAWSSAPMCSWKISHPARWTGSASVGAGCTS
jgi:crotonobetainyl-CoA:carnitine CoA-transferase CaiB-like acyl-CoA transferase